MNAILVGFKVRIGENYVVSNIYDVPAESLLSAGIGDHVMKCVEEVIRRSDGKILFERDGEVLSKIIVVFPESINVSTANLNLLADKISVFFTLKGTQIRQSLKDYVAYCELVSYDLNNPKQYGIIIPSGYRFKLEVVLSKKPTTKQFEEIKQALNKKFALSEYVVYEGCELNEETVIVKLISKKELYFTKLSFMPDELNRLSELVSLEGFVTSLMIIVGLFTALAMFTWLTIREIRVNPAIQKVVTTMSVAGIVIAIAVAVVVIILVIGGVAGGRSG